MFALMCVCLLVIGVVALLAQAAPPSETKDKEEKPKTEEDKPKTKDKKDPKIKDDISNQELEQKFEIVSLVLDIVSKHYVEHVNRKKLVEGALRGIMAELDPYSSFLTKENLEEMQIDLRGELQGIGVYITLDDNNVLTVITPIEGTPAYRAGILSGDKILEIDGVSTKDFSLHDAVKRIRGPRGTKVKLTVFHVDKREKETITVIRERIPITSVKEGRIIDEEAKIGFIRLVSFQKNTEDEMRKALRELTGKGMKGLVLDLRDNGGGLLGSAINIADLFLKEGVIVSVKGRGGMEPRPPWKAHGEGTYSNFPIVVLVNNYSASASEILAAALRDNHRAILVGEKTFGKGSVQKLILLKDSSGIKLTIQRYYTPNGISIDKKGIVPDIIEKMSIETKLYIIKKRREELIKKNKNEKLKEKPEGDKKVETPQRDPELQETIEYVKQLKEEKEKEFVDTQLQRAVDILKGVQVYRKKLGLKK
jgi:carboxyl-terminal processing protease